MNWKLRILASESREATKTRYPIKKAEKRQGHSVKVVGEKMYVTGHLYKPSYGSTAYTCRSREEHLNILSWTVKGLVRILSDTDFLDLVSDHGIVIVKETWILPNTHYHLDIKGFISSHTYGIKSVHARKGRFSGGISVYFRSFSSYKIKIIEKNLCGFM